MRALSDKELGNLKEELADYAHNAWSHWMEYLFSKSSFNVDGSATIPEHLVSRWLWQVRTKYENLPEAMKKSDQAEADKMLAIISDEGRADELL